MGADGAATLVSAGGVPTITQPITKLHILQGTVIMGVSGQVGLAQLYCDRVGKLWEGNQLGQGTSLPDVQRLLHKAIGQDAQTAVADAAASVPLMGNAIASQLAITQSLVAVPVGGFKGRPELIQCNHVGMAEAANDDLPYKTSAKELSQEEIKEHRQHIAEAEDHLKSFGENPQGIPASSPKAPTPPS